MIKPCNNNGRFLLEIAEYFGKLEFTLTLQKLRMLLVDPAIGGICNVKGGL
jgi:hypothetical protein